MEVFGFSIEMWYFFDSPLVMEYAKDLVFVQFWVALSLYLGHVCTQFVLAGMSEIAFQHCQVDIINNQAQHILELLDSRHNFSFSWGFCFVFLQFTMHSDLGKIVQSLLDEFWKNPPVLAPSSTSFP